MKVAYVGGFWSTNIGNSFYNMGALWVLEKVYGKGNVYFVPDPPQWYWNTRTNYDYISRLNVDLVVISGPCLGEELIRVYKSVFDVLAQRGVSLGFVSVSATKYSREEAKVVGTFLNKYKVKFMMTRDEPTHALYRGILKCPLYNGICTSMFLDEVVQLPALTEEPYVVFCFSIKKEPIITNNGGSIEVRPRKGLFNFQLRLDGRKIIRTNHSSFSRNKYLLFNRPRMYYSDLPHGYLTIIKNAEELYSDRVHACAAALVLGVKAMYIPGTRRSLDGRSKLLDRLKCGEANQRPISLNRSYIEREKEKLVDACIRYG